MSRSSSSSCPPEARRTPWTTTKKEKRLDAVLDEELALLVTSWLTFAQTTWLRAACRSCEELFVRNCPAATTQFVFLESVEPPELLIDADDSFEEGLRETPRQNRHASRCWRLPISRAKELPRECKLRLFSDRDFVLAAVAQNGRALKFADASLRRDRDVVLAAVAQSRNALYYADASLRSDRDVVLAAGGETNPWALKAAIQTSSSAPPSSQSFHSRKEDGLLSRLWRRSTAFFFRR